LEGNLINVTQKSHNLFMVVFHSHKK